MRIVKLTRAARPVLAVAAIVLISSALPAAAPAKKEAFFTRGDLTPTVALYGKRFHIPTVLGPTGMNGWILGDALVVREVENGSPADGIVMPNDMLLAVNAEALGEVPLQTLGEQVELSEQSGTMTVTLMRSGKPMTVTLAIRKLGAFGPQAPYSCAKSRAIHIDTCEFLDRSQNRDGTFDGRMYVGYALNGLTWLASEDPKYWENARRLAYSYAQRFDPAEVGTVAWGWGHMGIFLAEYYFQTGDETVLPLCRRIAQTLVRSQHPCGSWGHGPHPGKGYVQGGLLNCAGAGCWNALILFTEAGVPVSKAALAKATHFFARFADHGTVPYGDHRPEFAGTGNGKDAQTGVGFALLGDRVKAEVFGRHVTDGYRWRNAGHTGGMMGFVWGNIDGIHNPHTPDYLRMVKHWQWMMNASRRWNGGFLAPESVIGSIYTFRGTLLSAGGLAQVYAVPARALRIHGAPKSVFAAGDLPGELTEGVKLYRALKFDELRKTVRPTSDLARQLLTAARRKEKDIELSLAKAAAAVEGDSPDPVLAMQIVNNLERFCGGVTEPRVEAMRIRLTSNKYALIKAAARVYEEYKWLTYTYPKARAAFEKLAADDEAGIYQRLARRELATPADASNWGFYCEEMYSLFADSWELNERSKAAMVRLSGLYSGNWPQGVAYGLLLKAGVISHDLAKTWTTLVPRCLADPVAVAPTWRMWAKADNAAPPADWASVGFDDSGWITGAGPITGTRETKLPIPRGARRQYVRIAFDAKGTNFNEFRIVLAMSARHGVVLLNGKPVAWSLQTPRDGSAMIALHPATAKLLRKGRNVLAVRTECRSLDIGLYARKAPPAAAAKLGPRAWAKAEGLGAPNLSRRTAFRKRAGRSVLMPNSTGLTNDPAGKPNADIHEIRQRLDADGYSLDERYKYFGHTNPIVRLRASLSMMRGGKDAIPYIRKALQSSDPRVIRSGCDAIAGPFGWAKGRAESLPHMPPTLAGQLAGTLAGLIDHEEMYIREGAILAMGNCGEAAWPYLDKIAAKADDPEWWISAAVGHVMRLNDTAKIENLTDAVAAAYRREQSVYGRNRLRSALVAMAKRGQQVDRVVALLMQEIRDGDDYFAIMATREIQGLGYLARSAVPAIDERLAYYRTMLAEAKTDSGRGYPEGQIKFLEGLKKRITTAPPKPRKR